MSITFVTDTPSKYAADQAACEGLALTFLQHAVCNYAYLVNDRKVASPSGNLTSFFGALAFGNVV